VEAAHGALSGARRDDRVGAGARGGGTCRRSRRHHGHARPLPGLRQHGFRPHREGQAEARAFYENFFAHGLVGFQNTCLGIWANDDGVIREDFTNLIDITEFYGFRLPEPRTARFQTVTVFPFEDGKIKGERAYFDRVFVLEQLGVAARFEITGIPT